MITISTFILALLALSFLIFIHELGHYVMALRVGMKVEVFSIGFGKPVTSWDWKGVKWQIGWLPFGGYVKIAGTDTDKDKDPFTVKGGFFSKTPWERIKVAFMGPFVNLVFALLLFGLIWMNGGREKNFVEYTRKIGWVDPQSELYKKGVRPGDEITAYNQVPFEAAKDHLYQPMVGRDHTEISGFRVNYGAKDKTPFDIIVKSYPNPNASVKGILTAGVLAPAAYIIYDKAPGGKEVPIPEGAPLAQSGLQYGDRIVWVNGHLIYSVPEITYLLNDGRALLTIQRGDQILLARVPAVESQEFKLEEFKDELIDWQYEAELQGVKLAALKILPYNLTNEGVVENALKLIDKDKEAEVFPENPFSYLEAPLQARDKILAVNGEPIKFSHEIIERIQKPKALVIVQKTAVSEKAPSYTEADALFDESLDMKAIDKIVKSIGISKTLRSSGDYRLLNDITPVKRKDVVMSPEKEAMVKTELLEIQKKVEAIEDPDKREEAILQLENSQNEYVIGLPPTVRDLKVLYNPNPWVLFTSVTSEIGHTLEALVTGSLNPKWLSGPIGIVRVVQTQAMLSLTDMLFWVGAISVNLGLLNLLPVPMLDGGTILICFFEMISGRRLKPKTLEKMILPFAILLIIFFLYVTYNDIMRLFDGWFK